MTALLTLSMIVKDEAKAIEATLKSVAPFIERWVILDTGSTDGTQDAIRTSLKCIPGVLHEEPFIDFASSRNRALDLAGTETDFVLWLDADDKVMHGRDLRSFLGAERPKQGVDREAYYMRITMGGSSFDSPRILRASCGWRFVGRVHEVLHKEGTPPPAYRVPGSWIDHNPGRVSMAQSRKRWERDVSLLEEEVEDRPGDPRPVFYLAQTYDCLDRLQEAEKTYLKRISMGGWREEVFESKARLARIARRRGDPWHEVMRRWLDAHSFCSHRAEPLYEIALHYYQLGDHALAFLFAKRGDELPLPDDRLFVDQDVYTFSCADIVAISGFYIGQYEIGEKAARKALEARPHDERVKKNLSHYETRKRSSSRR